MRKGLLRPMGKEADCPEARIIGVTADDSRIAAAKKTVAFMEKYFGPNHRQVKQARAMLERAMKATEH